MAETIEQLAVELSLEAQSFTKQMSSINKAIKQSEREFKNAARGVKDYEKSYVGLDKKIQTTSRQIDLYNTKLNKQKDEYTSLENVVLKQKSKLDQLENTLGKSSAEWQKQAQLVQKNSEKLSKLGSDINQTKSNINNLENELKQSQTAFDQLSNKTKTTAEKLSEIDSKASLAESQFNELNSELQVSGTFFQKLSNEANQLNSKLQSNIQKVDVYESEINTLNNALKSNTQEHNRLENEIKQTESALQQSKNKFSENSTEVNQLKQKLLQLKDSYNRVESEINENEKELVEYRTALSRTKTEVNNLSRELKQLPFDKLGNKIKNAGSSLKGFGQTLTTSVTMPVAASGAAAGKMAYDYDQGLAKVGSLVGKSGKEMREYDGVIKKMSKNTGVSINDLCESMYQGISAGADLGNIFDLIETAAKTAIGGFTTTENAVDGLTSTMNAFGLSYKDVNKLADKFILTQNKGKTTVEELAKSIGTVAPTANAAGVNVNELLSAIAALTMNGIATSEAMTAVKAALSNVIKPSSEAQKIAKKLGIEFNTTSLRSKGLAGFLEEVKKKTGGNIETMGKLFGSTEALNAMLILTGEGGETFNGVLGDMDGELNLVDESVQNMQESVGSQLKNAFNELKIAVMEMGDVLAPVIKFLAERIQDLARWFSGLDESTQKNIVTFVLLAAALGPVLMGIGQLMMVGGGLVSLIGKLTGAMGGATGATGGLSGALGVLASPVGVGVAVAALATLLAIVGENESAILSLQEKFGGVGFVISAVCEFISGTMQMTFGNLYIVILGVCDMIQALLDGPGGLTVTDAWDRMQNKIVLNTEEAMMKCTFTTSRGMSQMRHMSEEQLGGLVSTTDTLMKEIPSIAEGNYSGAANNIATQLAKMDSNQLLTLRGMNDTTKSMFQGINQSMTVEQMANQVEWNLGQMNKAGSLEVSDMEKDISSSMDILKKQVDGKTKEAASSADKNTKDLSNKVNQNTDELANIKIRNNSKSLAKYIDDSTKDASNKADNNTKDMANKVDSNADGMKKDATSSTNTMKDNLTSSTRSMSHSVIAEWNNIRSAYSKSIKGEINVTRTTTNVSKSILSGNESKSLSNNFRAFNLGQYQTTGGYYSRTSKASVNLTENAVNVDLRRIEKLLRKNDQESNITINLNLEKVEVKNDDDYKTMSKKLVKYMNIELEKIKSNNRKIKGGLIYA